MDGARAAAAGRPQGRGQCEADLWLCRFASKRARFETHAEDPGTLPKRPDATYTGNGGVSVVVRTCMNGPVGLVLNRP